MQSRARLEWISAVTIKKLPESEVTGRLVAAEYE